MTFAKVILGALILSWVLPAMALAHAQLRATTPEHNELVLEAPEEIILEFNEPTNPVAMRWIAPDGTASATDAAVDGLIVRVDPPPAEAGQGSFLLSWRVVSIDGHPVSGTLVISIGVPSDVPSLNGVNWAPASTWWAIATKFALTLCLIVGVGGAIFYVFVSQAVGPLRRYQVALALAVPVAALAIAAQGIDLLGAAPGQLVSVEAWQTGAGTSFVRTAGLSVLAALTALAVLASPLRDRKLTAMAIVALAWVLAAGSFAVSGHTAIAEPEGRAGISITLHGLALIFWLGALLPLMSVIKSDDSAIILRRFSNLAVPMVVVLLVSGAVLTGIHTGPGGFQAIGLSAYGVLLLIKVVSVIGLIALAIHNRLVLTPAITRDQPEAKTALRGSIKAEIALAVLIIAFASSFRLTPPPSTLAEELRPLVANLAEGDVLARLEMTPGRVGQNAIWIDVASAAAEAASQDDHGESDPAPSLVPIELNLAFVFAGEDIAPIEMSAALSEEGRWSAGPVNLPLEGDWTVRLDVLVTDFDIVTLTAPITLAR